MKENECEVREVGDSKNGKLLIKSVRRSSLFSFQAIWRT